MAKTDGGATIVTKEDAGITTAGPNPVSDKSAAADYRLIPLTMLPTFDPHSAGMLWNNAGTPTVSGG